MSVVFAPQEDTPVSCCGSVTGLVMFALWCFIMLYDLTPTIDTVKGRWLVGSIPIGHQLQYRPIGSCILCVAFLYYFAEWVNSLRCDVIISSSTNKRKNNSDNSKRYKNKQKYPIVFKEHGTGSTGCDLCVIIEKSSISIEPQRASPWTPARQNRQAEWEKILV